MGRDEMRAGDSDRQAVADRLKTALDEGRLDLHEYDERLQRTYAAKTYGDLDGLLNDLPGTVPPQHSQVAPQPASASGSVVQPEHRSRGALAWIGPYGGVVLVCMLVWAIASASSGHLNYFWPVWLLIPLILGMLGNRGGGGRSRPDREARRAARRDRRYR
jgi:hypothetical protein